MDELSYWLDNSTTPGSDRPASREDEIEGPPQHFASSSLFSLGVLPSGYRPQHRRPSPLTGRVHELTSLAGGAARGLAGDARACGADLADLASARLPKVSQPVLVATSVTAALTVATLVSLAGPQDSTQATQFAAERSTEQAASRSDIVRSPVAEPTTTTTTTTVTSTTLPPSTTTTTTTAAPRPKDSGPVGDDVWQRLSRCEAGGRNDAGAPYYGYFQFSASTWKSVGGTGLPNDHDYETQKSFAKKLQARSGWGQWPACSSKLGLR